MNRLLLVLMGLAIGAGALYALVPGEQAPMDDIDAASRQRLERVLQDSRSGR